MFIARNADITFDNIKLIVDGYEVLGENKDNNNFEDTNDNNEDSDKDTSNEKNEEDNNLEKVNKDNANMESSVNNNLNNKKNNASTENNNKDNNINSNSKNNGKDSNKSSSTKLPIIGENSIRRNILLSVLMIGIGIFLLKRKKTIITSCIL